MAQIDRVNIPNLNLYSTVDAKLAAIVSCLKEFKSAMASDMNTLSASDIGGFEETVQSIIDSQAK